ncbi:MAG: mechanosensitive ion channel [Phycisphaerae bacterium]|nr:mechanosensitive ion channel [Phycisphaerae bacterium]
MNRHLSISAILLILSFMTVAMPVQAQAEPGDSPSAQSASDPQIPVDELELVLRPLTKAEMEAEAAAWTDLLKAKVTEISQAKLQVKRLARDAEKAKETAEQREKLQETITRLEEERIALADRLQVVLTSLEEKGGDPAPHRAYVTAVSGPAVAIDVTDTAATWIAIRGWLTSKEGGLRWGKNIALFIVTLIVFWILSHILAGVTRRGLARSQKASALLKDFFVRLVSRTTLLAGVLVAVTMLEVNIGPVLAIVGAAGFVVAFALQGTLSNFASGLLILYYKPFDVGDAVTVAGSVSGSVESMNLVSTHIKSWDNQRIVVPNNSIWGNVITNITGLPIRRVDMTFGIAYHDDVDRARQVLESILQEHELVLNDPAPVVRVHELGDSSVNFICRPWSKTSDYWTVYWDVTRAVKKRFDAEGISIPFPQRDVHLHPATPASGSA